MRIRQINLDDDGLPDKVTAELTRDEALYIATLLGKQNGITANEVMGGGDAINHEVYDALVGDLFNRYWDDGTADALRERRNAA